MLFVQTYPRPSTMPYAPGSGNNYDSGVRAQVVILRMCAGWSAKAVSDLTGVHERSQRRMIAKATDRGYKVDKPLLLQYVDDAPRTGRPPEVLERNTEKVLAFVRQSKATRSYSCQQIADALQGQLSRESVRQILKGNGLNKVKRTTKPGLTQEMRNKRLAWCLDHKDVDLKRICFSDEKSIVLGQRRGSDRVWRTSSETYDPTCLKRRFKGSSTLMF